ncbi:uncharacterized protein K02A2.6-like isoform X1 [Amyelois transitella]|uniref:uncharacterized protein K02A2.6-like isoform X1 n=1 Tax=Amyelois transitella TaxID=680683 RepID=UPI00298F6A61|nr:uncharacterized protein K02A2.6-like isoform X1 [Amyelois transitella]
MAAYGVIKPFQDGDDIECFLERLEQYFYANNISKELRTSVLLTMIDEKVYKVIKSTLHPELPKTKTLVELQTALRLRYKTRISHFRKRTAFDKLQQEDGETITKWYARVCDSATECEFGTCIDDRVKDKFVTGMRSGPIFERLCEEPITKKLADLLDIALNKEAVLHERQAPVHRVTKSTKSTISQSSKSQGCNDEDHLNNLKEVLKRFKEVGIRLNKSKCLFFQNEINYLGHIISKEGLKKDPAKLEAIINAPVPNNVTEVRSWIGMVGYYSKFVPQLSVKLKPMYDLLQKDRKFIWTKVCNDSFEQVKKEIVSDNILIHFNRDLPLRLSCDASQNGIVAVLSHILPDGTDRPISFISRVYSKAEKGYSMIHKEALAIYWAVQKFYQYLVGSKFELQSDHKPLQALFGEHKSLPQMAAGRLQRWSTFLSGFNYTFKYIKGMHNVIADCMSRLPLQNNSCIKQTNEYEYINLVADQNIVNLNLVRSETRKDPILSSVFNMIRYGFPKFTQNNSLKPYLQKKNELYIDQNVIMWGYRVVIPEKLRSHLLKELHSTHEGIVKMKCNARSYFWWPGLDMQIENLIKSCDVCMTYRSEPPKAPIISWPRTKVPYERVHADFLGPIDNKMILLIIDSYSKWPEAFIVKSLDSKQTVERFRECFSRFGLPKVVVTDNAATFISKEFSEFLSKNGIVHETSPPFHPATNGFAENAVKTFKSALLKALKDKSNHNTSFETLMNRYLFHYRNSIHIVTGVSPSQLMFQRKLRTRLDLLSIPNVKAYDKGGKRKEAFKEGDIVYCRDYRNPNKKQFVKAMIDEVLGKRTYYCKVLNENLIWKRHLDQIISATQDYENIEDTVDKSYNVEPIDTSDKNSTGGEKIVITQTISPQGEQPQKPISPVNSETVLPLAEEGNSSFNSPTVQTTSEISSPGLRRSVRVRKAPQRLNL